MWNLKSFFFAALAFLHLLPGAQSQHMWTSTGGGWKSMFSNVALANVLKQAGLLGTDDGAISSFATNSGSTWFSLQFFFSEAFYNKTLTSTPEELHEFVVDWMNAYGTIYPSNYSDAGCPVPPDFVGFCPIIKTFRGSWAAFTAAMLQATSTAYGDATLGSRPATAENRVSALLGTDLSIQMSLTSAATVRANNTLSYLATVNSDVHSTPISTQFVISDSSNNSGWHYALDDDALPARILSGAAPENFTFDAFGGFFLYPGINASVISVIADWATTTTEVVSEFDGSAMFGGNPVISQLAAASSAAAGILSPLNTAMFAQLFSTQRAKIMFNPTLNETAKQYALAKLQGTVNALYHAPVFDHFAVCSQFPQPCTPSDLLFVDGIYTDNPSLALNLGRQQGQVGLDETLKVMIVNADPGDERAYNDALYLSYFSAPFNRGVKPGDYVWAPAHGAPWRSPQIFEEFMDAEMLAQARESVDDIGGGDHVSTSILRGTTIGNKVFGVTAGQKVELLLINLNYTDIPLDLVAPGYIANYTVPLADMTQEIASSSTLLDRIQAFFADAGGNSTSDPDDDSEESVNGSPSPAGTPVLSSSSGAATWCNLSPVHPWWSRIIVLFLGGAWLF